MATIKSFTDLEQSKKLAEILPIESADMCYINGDTDKIIIRDWQDEIHDEDDVPCWSLAALLSVLPKWTRILKSATDDTYHCACPKGNIDKWFDNSVDACYEMIIRLNELKML